MKLIGKRSLELKLRRMSDELNADANRIEGDDALRLKLIECTGTLGGVALYLTMPKPLGHGVPFASGWIGAGKPGRE